jgi:hypothetical protein
MGEETETKEEAPKEEKPKKEKPPKEKKPKKERPPRDGPILAFTGPEGAPKIVALMAALSTLLQANNLFWAGVNGANAIWVVCGVFLTILGLLLILTLDILNFGDPTLKKIEIFEKFYRFEVLLIFGALILLFEALSINFLIINAGALAVLLGGILVITAMILEIMRKQGKDIKPSKVVALVGIILAFVEIIFQFMGLSLASIWDGIVGVIVVILLLLSMYEKIKFIPYQWWMVLILGYILFGWVGTLGGTLVLISFILMLLE